MRGWRTIMGIQINRGANKMTEEKPDNSWLARFINFITQNRFSESHRESKHRGDSRKSFTGDAARKVRAKKKIKRKMSYQSRRINQIRAKRG